MQRVWIWWFFLKGYTVTRLSENLPPGYPPKNDGWKIACPFQPVLPFQGAMLSSDFASVGFFGMVYQGVVFSWRVGSVDSMMSSNPSGWTICPFRNSLNILTFFKFTRKTTDLNWRLQRCPVPNLWNVYWNVWDFLGPALFFSNSDACHYTRTTS